MESGDGVELELNIGPVEKDSETNGFISHINKENEIIENGADAVGVDSGSEGASKIELANSAGDKNEVSESTAENKASNPSKKGESDGKNQVKKTQKGPGRLNGSLAESQKKRNVLSQSASFPARGSLANNMSKCTTFTKQSKVTTSNGDTKHSTLPAASTAQKTSTNLKTGSVEATINGISAEAAESSTLCGRKSIGCTFNFKLDERAEKRKEFFMKLEEKNHAKELEETNLQAKSKENQEAEIRRLRKSLNFKATPMPNFYQDSGPPKIELKKIPPTRAKSPKLGRRKPFVTAADSPSEAGNSCEAPCLLTSGSTELNEGAASSKVEDALTSKNPKQKPFPKHSSSKLKPTQSGSKPLEMNPKISNLKSKLECVEVENISDRPAEVPAETSGNSELASPEDNRVEGDKTIANLPRTDTETVQVSVQSYRVSSSSYL